MRILVTGAGGYVGGRLVPMLLERGHDVRTTTSAPDRPQPWWVDDVEQVVMDALDPAQVLDACRGTETVFYLVHSMRGGDFADEDRRAAANLAAASSSTGVKRIVYLSGLVPAPGEGRLSAHLSSRLEVEEVLRSGTVPAITLRAAVIIGSGSTSFEIARQVAERLPLHTIPASMNSRVQPIALLDVLEALCGALDHDGPARHYDVGGPEQLSYADLLRRISHWTGLLRPQVAFPDAPTAAVGGLIAAVTDVPGATVEPLIESLRHDMVCRESDFIRDLLPAGHELMPLDEAIHRALAEGVGAPGERDPMGPMPDDPAWADGGSGRSTPLKAADVLARLLF